MPYLIWSILNISIFFFFLYVCFRAVKLLREHHGIFLAIVFVLGLIGILSGSRSALLEGDGNRPTWKFASDDSLRNRSLSIYTVGIDSNMLFTHLLYITYAKAGQQAPIPVSALSTISGFQSGTSFMPTGILLNPTNEPGRFSYEVQGTEQWSLLGMPLYSRLRQWKGEVTLP